MNTPPSPRQPGQLPGMSRPGAAPPRRQRLRGSLLAGVVAAGLAAAAAVPAAASGPGGPARFGLAPTPVNGQPRPWFRVNLAPGRAAADTVTVTNAGTITTTLRITASAGVTAPNSGTAFDAYSRTCAREGCWVTGLPPTVTLPPGTRETLRFTVAVPGGTAPGQYLAGITAQPATPPPPVSVGTNGRASAKAVIITQITVGVAITVGSPSRLRTRISIPAVTAGTVGAAGTTPRLDVHIDNTGQTFTRAAGTATCAAGTRRLSYPVAVGTILPGDSATVPVNAPRLPPGTPLPCTVRLRYGNGLASTWSGSITIPTAPHTVIIHTGPGAYSTLPQAGIPAWAIALIATGALSLAALITAIVLLLRTNRRTPGQQEPPQRRTRETRRN